MPENWLKAARFYIMSAQAGNPEGQSALARAYRFGIGVKQNRAEWFRRAAAHDAEVQHYLDQGYSKQEAESKSSW